MRILVTIYCKTTQLLSKWSEGYVAMEITVIFAFPIMFFNSSVGTSDWVDQSCAFADLTVKGW
jgi:hypothetical protein